MIKKLNKLKNLVDVFLDNLKQSTESISKVYTVTTDNTSKQ